METGSGSLKFTARLAGVLYLIWIISALFSVFYIPSQINTKGDITSAAQNILANEYLFRISIINELFNGTIWVILLFVLYRLLKSVDDRQAKLLVAFVIVQIPADFMKAAFNFTSLMILKGTILKTFEPSQVQELAIFFLRINDHIMISLGLFWGLWLFPLAILVYKSHFLPRFLGVWLSIDGLALVVVSLSGLLAWEYKDIVAIIAFPAELGEVALMLWLLIRGVKPLVTNTVLIQ